MITDTCVFWFVEKQMGAGAAVLTDSIYWTVIFPFLSLQDYEMSFVSFRAIYRILVKACTLLMALSTLHLTLLNLVSTSLVSKFCVFR